MASYRCNSLENPIKPKKAILGFVCSNKDDTIPLRQLLQQ